MTDHPDWLFHDMEQNITNYGRWQKHPDQAKYIREDLATTTEDWKSLAMENERSVQHWIAKFDVLQATLTARITSLEEELGRTRETAAEMTKVTEEIEEAARVCRTSLEHNFRPAHYHGKLEGLTSALNLIAALSARNLISGGRAPEPIATATPEGLAQQEGSA